MPELTRGPYAPRPTRSTSPAQDSLSVAEFNTIVRALRSAERLNYPKATDTVSIGNVVGVAYSLTDHEHILVAEYTRSLDLSPLLPQLNKPGQLQARWVGRY